MLFMSFVKDSPDYIRYTELQKGSALTALLIFTLFFKKS